MTTDNTDIFSSTPLSFNHVAALIGESIVEDDAARFDEERKKFVKQIGKGSFGVIFSDARGEFVIKVTKDASRCQNFRHEFDVQRTVFAARKKSFPESSFLVRVLEPRALFTKRDRKGRLLECFFKQRRLYSAIKAGEEPFNLKENDTRLTQIYMGRETLNRPVPSMSRPARGRFAAIDVQEDATGRFIGWKEFVTLAGTESKAIRIAGDLGAFLAEMQVIQSYNMFDVEYVYAHGIQQEKKKTAENKLYAIDYDKVERIEPSQSGAPATQARIDAIVRVLTAEFQDDSIDVFGGGYYPVPTTPGFRLFLERYLAHIGKQLATDIGSPVFNTYIKRWVDTILLPQYVRRRVLGEKSGQPVHNLQQRFESALRNAQEQYSEKIIDHLSAKKYEVRFQALLDWIDEQPADPVDASIASDIGAIDDTSAHDDYDVYEIMRIDRQRRATKTLPKLSCTVCSSGARLVEKDTEPRVPVCSYACQYIFHHFLD